LTNVGTQSGPTRATVIMMLTSGARQPSCLRMVVAACALQLLQHPLHSARAAAIPGRELSPDHLTLRYHGRDAQNFGNVNNFPIDVCSKAPATCMDLRLWECAHSPADMRVPYSAEARLGVVAFNETFDPPLENTGGSRLLLARRFSAGQSQIVLWSGCNGSCADCVAGTGKLWVLEGIPSCTATAPRHAFGVLYNSGNQNTYSNCWNAMDAYDPDAERLSGNESVFEYAAFVLAFGLVPIFCCAFAALFICRRAERRAPGIGAGGAAGPLPTIGKVTSV